MAGDPPVGIRRLHGEDERNIRTRTDVNDAPVNNNQIVAAAMPWLDVIHIRHGPNGI